MEKLSQKITEQIKKKGIKQKSWIFFFLKNNIFWLLFGLAVIVGAMAFSVILYAVLESDFEVLEYASDSAMGFFLLTLPIYWIICFGLFLMIALYSFRHTKKGYRIPISALLVGNIIMSITFGLLFYGLIGAKMIENTLARVMPFYVPIEHRKENMWMKPEKGFLMGKIQEHLPEDQRLILHDPIKHEWTIEIDSVDFIHPIIQQMIDEDRLQGERIKILGKAKNEEVFTASSLLPWERRGHGGMLRKDFLGIPPETGMSPPEYPHLEKQKGRAIFLETEREDHQENTKND